MAPKSDKQQRGIQSFFGKADGSTSQASGKQQKGIDSFFKKTGPSPAVEGAAPSGAKKENSNIAKVISPGMQR